MSAVHDIAYLTDLVERLNSELQNLRQLDHVEQVVQVPVQSGLQQSRNVSLETLTALAHKMDGLERYFVFSVSDELSFLKRHLNSTTIHQLKAVHDIATLSAVIETLRTEIRNMQTSRTGNYGTESLSQKVESIERHLTDLSSSTKSDKSKLSKELSAIKRNVNLTISHQLNAVHDIAAIAKVIEGILKENQI